MTARDDLDRRLDAFLLDGPDELPTESYEAARERVDRTRQRVVIGPWRFPEMNKLVPIGIGAAAVVVVLVAGTQLLGQPTSGGVGGAPSASPVPASSAAGLPAGPFSLTDGQSIDGMTTKAATVTIAAPGWEGEPGGGVLSKNGVEAPAGAGMIVFYGDLFPYGDPCRWLSTRPETPASTVDEVVAALEAQALRDASSPVDVTLDGHAGKGITLHVPDDAVFRECDGAKFGSWGLSGPDQTPMRYHQSPGQIDEVWVVDVDGELAIVDWTYYEGTPQATVDELRAIVESISFE